VYKRQGDVTAEAEEAAFGGDEHGAYVAAFADLTDDDVDFVAEIGAEDVTLVGAVEGDVEESIIKFAFECREAAKIHPILLKLLIEIA